MVHMSLEEITQNQSEQLKKDRILLFPLMGYNVITGLNIYESEAIQKSEHNFILSYLHSELDEKDAHRQELEEKLKTSFGVMLFRKINFEKIDRYTSYRLKSGWEAQRYYNMQGTELKGKDLERARFLNEPIIGVAYQNELDIFMDDLRNVEEAVRIFREYCNAYLINPINGRCTLSEKRNKMKNKERITDAWEVPLIILKSKADSPNLEAYPQIKEVIIERDDFFINILVDNKAKTLFDFLAMYGEQFDSSSVYANRVFVDWINKGLYSQAYKTFMKKFRSAQQKLSQKTNQDQTLEA